MVEEPLPWESDTERDHGVKVLQHSFPPRDSREKSLSLSHQLLEAFLELGSFFSHQSQQ